MSIDDLLPDGVRSSPDIIDDDHLYRPYKELMIITQCKCWCGSNDIFCIYLCGNKLQNTYHTLQTLYIYTSPIYMYILLCPSKSRCGVNALGHNHSQLTHYNQVHVFHGDGFQQPTGVILGTGCCTWLITVCWTQGIGVKCWKCVMIESWSIR